MGIGRERFVLHHSTPDLPSGFLIGLICFLLIRRRCSLILIPLVDLGVIRGWRAAILCCRQHRSYGQQAQECAHAKNDSEIIFHKFLSTDTL